MEETNERENIVQEEESSDINKYKRMRGEGDWGKMDLENQSMLSSGSLSLEQGVNTCRR